MEIKSLKPLTNIEAVDLLGEASKSAGKSGRRAVSRLRAFLRLLLISLVLVLKISFLLGLGLLLWHAYYYALNSERFNLSEIKFEGNQRLETINLQKAIETEFPQNLIRIDLKKIQARVEQESWVRKAEVRRLLPGTLKINVIERTPCALALVGGELTMIDREGTILGKYESKFGKFDVPILKGLWSTHKDEYLQANKKRADVYFRLIEELDSAKKNYSKAISEIDVSNVDDAILLLMNDTAPIHIGDRHFLRRYQTFLANLTEYQKLKDKYGTIESVDLRFENQIVCRTAKKS